MYILLINANDVKDYVAKLGATKFMVPNSISKTRYGGERLVTATSRQIAIVALVNGAKVYETLTMQGLFPEYKKKEEVISKIIDEFFEAIGIRKNVKGYECLKYMLTRYVEDDLYCVKSICDEVYPECANKFGVTSGTISKNVKDLLKYSYERNALKYEVLFAHTGVEPLKEAPKPREFLAVIGTKIRDLVP